MSNMKIPWLGRYGELLPTPAIRALVAGQGHEFTLVDLDDDAFSERTWGWVCSCGSRSRSRFYSPEGPEYGWTSHARRKILGVQSRRRVVCPDCQGEMAVDALTYDGATVFPNHPRGVFEFCARSKQPVADGHYHDVDEGTR